MNGNSKEFASIASLVIRYVKTDESSLDAKKIAKEIENRTCYQGLKSDFKSKNIFDPNDQVINLEEISKKKLRITPDLHCSEVPLWTDPTSDDSTIVYCEKIMLCRTQRNDRGNAYVSKPNNVNHFLWEWIVMKQILRDLYYLYSYIQPFCTSDTCKTMGAKPKYTYLCACHTFPKECCAIDYFSHNLLAANTDIYQSKSLPPYGSYSSKSEKKLGDLLRRLYRLYIHSISYHEDQFLDYEKRYHGFEHFHAYIDTFGLVTKDKLQPYVSYQDIPSE
ncbi:hypothetical protein WA158_001006 [Blastocystis sp. Blastoise]